MSARKPQRRKSSASGRHSDKDQGELRIIGGQWRGRKLRFPAVGGVRPTPSRIRETLFNWLSFHTEQARCLDLFAGSGVLGLEALSRGAAQVVLVDHTPALAQALRDHLTLLQSSGGEVVCQDVGQFLRSSPPQPFDIVFMDPPFRQNWLSRLTPLLDEGGWIRAGTWVYTEHESEAGEPEVPAHWQLHRSKTAGQVTYRLYRAGEPATGTPATAPAG